MGLSERIKEAIDGSEKSKADVARACKVTNAAVTHWLTGDTKSMKAATALALEDVTGYRAHWILYGKGAKRAAVYWPFSEDLLDAVKKLGKPDLLRLEGVMRAHLGLVTPAQSGAGFYSAVISKASPNRVKKAP